jgi:hypothetical protein
MRAIGLAFATALLCGCGGEAPTPENAAAANEPARVCIESVLAEDSELGKVRNHAPETAPIAESARAYVQGLHGLDFTNCPAAFAEAFARHRAAWEASIVFFEAHGERRGEMHDVFDAIRAVGGETAATLRAHESEIWGTWSEVEAATEATP